MTLTLLVPVLGPPGAGKTTLTRHLGQTPGRTVFRLREQVPERILAATASNGDRLGWIDDASVATALDKYVEFLEHSAAVHTAFLDNFPGTGSQVSLLLSILRQAAPDSVVRALEPSASPAVLALRAANRRVCQHCERDPIGDPRLPAAAHPEHTRRCGTCGVILDPRRGDSPKLLNARMQRYQQAIAGTRSALHRAGVVVQRVSTECSPDTMAVALAPLLSTRRSSS